MLTCELSHSPKSAIVLSRQSSMQSCDCMPGCLEGAIANFGECESSQVTLPRSQACAEAIGDIGALLNRVLQPRPLVVLGLNVWMGTAAGADELVEIPTDACAHPGSRRTPFFLSTSTSGPPLKQEHAYREGDHRAGYEGVFRPN